MVDEHTKKTPITRNVIGIIIVSFIPREKKTNKTTTPLSNMAKGRHDKGTGY